MVLIIFKNQRGKKWGYIILNETYICSKTIKKIKEIISTKFFAKEKHETWERHTENFLGTDSILFFFNMGGGQIDVCFNFYILHIHIIDYIVNMAHDFKILDFQMRKTRADAIEVACPS